MNELIAVVGIIAATSLTMLWVVIHYASKYPHHIKDAVIKIDPLPMWKSSTVVKHLTPKKVNLGKRNKKQGKLFDV